jgi:hypothetical protein
MAKETTKLNNRKILSTINASIDAALIAAAGMLGEKNNKAAVTIKIELTRQEDGRIEFFPTAECKGKQYSIGGKAKGKSVIAELEDGELRNVQIGMFDKKHKHFTPDAESNFDPGELEQIEDAMAEAAEE